MRLHAGLACLRLGTSLADIQKGIAQTSVPGRMEVITQTNGAKVFVDYAHNGDSLEKLLSVVEEHQKGDLHLILGATGNKGESRRADFARVINAHPNLHVILTADDPNYEDPQAIAEEIASQVTRPLDIQVDREKAISQAMARTNNETDAVIIAGPDHWHSTIAMAAARAGKHVYCEKPLSWTVPETYMVRQVIKETGVVFQLGHQGRQTDCYQKAEEIIGNGLLGPVNLIEVCTNRNSPNGAWVYDIIEGSNPNTIDWKQFEGDPERIKEYMDYMTSNKLERYIGPDERSKFSLERFFRWRCWWDYSTGLSGDLLTHEYDAVNQIMHVGIPHSATSSGGVYFFKDGRTVPDVLQTTFELAGS